MISILRNEKNNSIVLLFYCFMGNAQKIRYLEIFRKKKYFFKILFFQNSLKTNMEMKKNISIVLLFYCVMGNAQKKMAWSFAIPYQISDLVRTFEFFFFKCAYKIWDLAMYGEAPGQFLAAPRAAI